MKATYTFTVLRSIAVASGSYRIGAGGKFRKPSCLGLQVIAESQFFFFRFFGCFIANLNSVLSYVRQCLGLQVLLPC